MFACLSMMLSLTAVTHANTVAIALRPLLVGWRPLPLGARTLLGTKGIATRNKKLLGAPGLTTRSKDATRVEAIAISCKASGRLCLSLRPWMQTMRRDLHGKFFV